MISIVSYNVLMHKAYGEVSKIASQAKADILCLQEVRPKEIGKEIAGLTLAKSVQMGSIGLATYYNSRVFSHHSSNGHQLPRAAYELTAKEMYRLIITTLTHKKSGVKLAVGNVHLANLYATNSARRKQADAIFREMNELADHHGQLSAVVAGDFNYPFFVEGLIQLAEKHGYKDSANGTIKRTHLAKIARHQFDRIFTSKLETKKYEVLPFGESDHAPIVVALDL